MSNQTESAILLIHCPNTQGVVAAVSKFIFDYNGNILELDQHVDPRENHFFMRVRWDIKQFEIPKDEIVDAFANKVGIHFGMKWRFYFKAAKSKMVIFVSKFSHCLYDILQRYKSNEWNVEIPLIISNHPNLSYIAEQFDIPYHVFSITKENKQDQEAKELELLEKHKPDFIVLARYMQVLTQNFINQYPSKIINIHHSSLPAFPGAKPYHSAHKRGVKIIGATSHYVTEDLDAGPIISQDITRVTHKDSVKDMIRKGKDLEKTVLSQAIWLQLQHKILPYKNKSMVFY